MITGEARQPGTLFLRGAEMDPLAERKWDFVERELIATSINSAFQRASVYADGGYADCDRVALRDELIKKLKAVAKKYENGVSSDRHTQNIKTIADDLTAQFKGKGLLREDRFRIGIAQKALNLYLKYLWCLGKIPTPPHCPFDSGIIAALGEPRKWTQLDSPEEYQALVDAGKRKIKETGHASLSDWELDQWNKETNT
jgi:hypothetical protein